MKPVGVQILRAAFVSFVSFASLIGRANAADQFVYVNADPQVVNQMLPNKVLAYRVGTNGALSAIPGSPFVTGGTGGGGHFFASNRIVVSTPGNFLYASNSLTNDVSAFAIDPSSGNLTAVPGSPFHLDNTSPGLGGISLAVTPNGKFLMAGNPVSETITSFTIGVDGSLTAVPGSPFPAGGTTLGMKVSPDSQFLAVGLLGRVAMFRIAPGGSLTFVQGSPFPVGGVGSAAGVDINCKGNLLFVGEENNSRITVVDVFRIASDGILTPITGSPFVADAGANSSVPLLSPDDRFLFVSNLEPETPTSTLGTVTVFSVAADGTLSLIPGSPFAEQDLPVGMAVNRAGTFLFTGKTVAVGALSIANDGSLTSVPGSPFSVPEFSASAQSLAAFPAKTCPRVPTSKDECKNGGWQSFDVPRTFKNQGDCVQFVETGK